MLLKKNLKCQILLRKKLKPKSDISTQRQALATYNEEFSTDFIAMIKPAFR